MGFVYLLRPEFMPYHAVALGKSWAEIDEILQILLLALMKVIGGAWLATAVAVSIMLVIPFRRGLFWARWAIPVVGLIAELPVLYATLLVARNTPASPPWLGVLFTVGMLAAGLILSLESRRAEQADALARKEMS